VTFPPHRKAIALFTLLAPLAGCHHSDFPTVPDDFREFAYVANSGSNTVTVLDLVYLRVDRTLRVGEHPVAVALNPKKPEAYVLNRPSATQDGSISVIDTAKNEVVATIPVQRGPSAISVDPSGDSAYIANSGSNTITVLDLTTRRSLVSLRTADSPTSALISPDGRTLVVTSASAGTVSLYSAAPILRATKTPFGPTLSATQADPLRFRASFAGCPGATSPVIPDSSKAFIACPAANQVLALSLAAAPGSWAAKQEASSLVDHALAVLDVGQNPTSLTRKPDGGEIFVSNSDSGSISEISTQTNEVGSTFGIGDRPAHGVVSFDNAILWVSNSGADSVSLYSIDDGKRLPSIHVGNAPDALAFTTDHFSAEKAQRFLLVANRQSGDVAVIRTNSSAGPALLTMLPAGASPDAIAIQSQAATP
jgi:YVTN family beta-propeller protein